IVGGQSSHFALTTNPPAFAKSRRRLEKFEKMVKADGLGRELAEEGRRLLARMPKLEAMRKLRKEYQKLVDGEQTLGQMRRARADVLETTRLAPRVAHNF